MIDLEKMAKQHEKLFPNATAESQVWKLEEEIKEYLEAESDSDLKELADIIIVCGGLYRWLPMVARAIADYFMFHFSINPRSAPRQINIYQGVITGLAIQDEVNHKWQINLKRKWKWNGKTYHHVD